MLSSMIMPHWQIMEQHLDMGGLPKQRFSAKSSRLISIGAQAQAKGLKPKHSKAVRHHAEISQYLLLLFSHHCEIILLNHYDETINSHQFSHHSLEPTRTCNFTMFQILMQCRLRTCWNLYHIPKCHSEIQTTIPGNWSLSISQCYASKS